MTDSKPLPEIGALPEMEPSAYKRSASAFGRLEYKSRPTPIGGFLRSSAIAVGERLVTEAYRDGQSSVLAAIGPLVEAARLLVEAHDNIRTDTQERLDRLRAALSAFPATTKNPARLPRPGEV